MRFLLLVLTLVWAMAPESGAGRTPELSEGKKVIVYYFHTNVRCPTCKKIEQLTQSTIAEKFHQELESGELVWRLVNTDLPENGHFVDRYQLITKSVVLSEEINGEEQRFSNLPKIWELIGSDDEYRTYIRSEVATFLGK